MEAIARSSKKQDLILDFIRKRGSVSQPEIVAKFHNEFGYRSLGCARASISQMCRKIESRGQIHKKSEKNDSRGQIDKNIWYYSGEGSYNSTQN